MAKFRYRMQNILDIKMKLENQEKAAYAMANAKLLEEQEKLQKIMMRRASYERKGRELIKGDLNLQEIGENRRAVDIMKGKQRDQAMSVHSAERNVEIARERLNAVMIERKTHEKLREKEFEEFKRELERAESKEIDELVSYTYHEG